MHDNQDYRASSAYSSTPNQTWDELNRPTSLIDDDGNTVTLNWTRDEYKLTSWVVGGVTRTLQYDANDRVVRVTATGSESWDVEYAYDQAGLSAFKTGGDWYYLDRSQRGDVTAIRNSSGVVQAQLRYTAYGEQWSDNTTLARKLGATYNGRDGVLSLSRGLSWMQHRVYSSSTGRFVSADPVEARIGALQAGYNYADGDPITASDPTGHAKIPVGACSVDWGAWNVNRKKMHLEARVKRVYSAISGCKVEACLVSGIYWQSPGVSVGSCGTPRAVIPFGTYSAFSVVDLACKKGQWFTPVAGTWYLAGSVWKLLNPGLGGPQAC